MTENDNLLERIAVAETLIAESKNIIHANQVSIRKIQAKVMEHDSKWVEMSKKLEEMSKYFDIISNKIDGISDEMKEQKIIDLVEMQTIEKQRKKFIALAGTLGAIFIALVEQYDVIISMLAKLAGSE